MIRLVVVDDHAVVRRGLADMLDAVGDMELVAAAENGEEGVAVIEEHRPDVALVDLSMPGIDGVEVARQVQGRCPEVNVVMLTSFSERERILAAVHAGARGYLLKDAEPEELIRGIRAAAQGEAPFSPKAASALLPEAGAATPVAALTAREAEVLGHLVKGLANKQIAQAMGITEKTVKTHLTSVFATIGVSDRTQAALWATRNGIGTEN